VIYKASERSLELTKLSEEDTHHSITALVLNLKVPPIFTISLSRNDFTMLRELRQRLRNMERSLRNKIAGLGTLDYYIASPFFSFINPS